MKLLLLGCCPGTLAMHIGDGVWASDLSLACLCSDFPAPLLASGDRVRQVLGSSSAGARCQCVTLGHS